VYRGGNWRGRGAYAGWNRGWNRGGYRYRFGRPYYGYGFLPFYAAAGYGLYNGCYQWRRVPTPWGWQWRRVNVCYYW
jgi:hypothetical protein